ncbi:MAG: bactofilin family protein [Steroidobacteraceae bacterium]
MAKQTRIEGDVAFQGGLHLDGRVRGAVLAADGSTATLWIGEAGRIEGDVVVTNLVVDGEIHGSVRVAGRAVIGPKARIVGDLHYGSLETAMGARIEGKLIPAAGATEAKSIASDRAPPLELSPFDAREPRT